jgi:hypothetical protein
MDLDERTMERLNLLGLKTSTEAESRTVSLLRIVLRLQSEVEQPIEFAEIYDAVLQEEKEELSKTWVHRLLKGLTDAGLVCVEGNRSYRKRFIADANTLARGFEQLKAQRMEDVETEIRELEEEVEGIQDIDCALLAQEVIATITGREEAPRARFIQGIEELDRVLRYAIADVAKEGDIIRATVMHGRPFLEGGIERTYKFVRAAERGAEIRYMFRPEFFALDEEVTEKMGPEAISRFVKEMLRMKAQGIPFLVRLSKEPKTYNQVALNAEKIALIITEAPLNATLVTKEFNPDLVENAIKNFDLAWHKALSIDEFSKEQFQMIVEKGPTAVLDVLGLEKKETG